MGYSRTLPADGGRGRFGLPAICLTNEPILDSKTTFDSSGLEISEYVAKLYLNVTGDVTDRVEIQVFNICHCSLRRAKQPYRIEISRWNDMGRVWDTSTYHPKPL